MSYPQLRIILPEKGTACVTDSGRCEKIQNTLEAWQRLELVPYKKTRDTSIVKEILFWF